MSGKELLGTISIIIAAVSYSAYFLSIFRGRTKPHMFSWIVWGTVSGVASYAQFAKGGGPGSWGRRGKCGYLLYRERVGLFPRREKYNNQ